VGRAVVQGMQRRSRWVVVPGWVRPLIALGRLIQPLAERNSYDPAVEADTAFQEDVDRRGVEAASAPIGAGGQAVERETAGST